MNILFICQYFPPEPGAPAARTHEHAREWARLGHVVTVVCGVPNHPDGVIPPKYKRHFIYEEIEDGIRVLRCWFFAAPNAGRFRRSAAFVSFMAAALFWGAVKGGRCDVVLATSPQLLCGLAGWLTALIKRRPFVFEVRDLWPQQIVDLGVLRNPMIIGWLQRLEMLLYRKSQAIVAVAPAAAESIIGRGIASEKVHTITNAIDLEFFSLRPRMGAMRLRYGWGDRILAMYIGTHGMSQGLETVLEAARLLERRRDLHFVFIGSGAERQSLIDKAERMGLANVEFIPSQPRGDMPDFYAAADICLAPLKRRDVFRTNIPSKLFEIMACARPVILGAEGQAREVLEAAGAGVVVTPEDPQALAQAVEMLADNPAARSRFGEQGRRHVEKHYSRAQRARALLEILERVVAGEALPAD